MLFTALGLPLSQPDIEIIQDMLLIGHNCIQWKYIPLAIGAFLNFKISYSNG